MDNFDIIYYINLEHRTDRKEHIISELNKFQNLKDILRVNAYYNKQFGPIGCLKSHILALSHFVESDYEKCLILEDDFQFTESPEFVNEILSKFFNGGIDYDVLMLSSNTLKQVDTPYNFITKIIDAQTASGYSVHKQFAKTLLDNFKESLELLEKNRIQHLYALDIYWKRLQPGNKWYCLNPKIGKQMEGYSDNEQGYRNYGV
jgi:GR25 family glycosyltransferase involved in LPS biosynthesis